MKPCGKSNRFVGFVMRILFNELLPEPGFCLINILDVKMKNKHLLIDPSFQGGNVGHLHRLLSVASSSQVFYYFCGIRSLQNSI